MVEGSGLSGRCNIKQCLVGFLKIQFELHHEKINNVVSETGPIRTEHRSRLEAENFKVRKKRNLTIRVVKIKVLMCFAVTAKLICAFVFAYAKCWVSHDVAHLFCLKKISAFRLHYKKICPYVF